MFKRLWKRKAQSTLEYAILIGVISAALVGMQLYLKRGYQGKVREGADSMGQQFSAELTTYNYTTNSFTNSSEAVEDRTTTTNIVAQTSNRWGNEVVSNIGDESLF